MQHSLHTNVCEMWQHHHHHLCSKTVKDENKRQLFVVFISVHMAEKRAWHTSCWINFIILCSNVTNLCHQQEEVKVKEHEKILASWAHKKTASLCYNKQRSVRGKVVQKKIIACIAKFFSSLLMKH